MPDFLVVLFLIAFVFCVIFFPLYYLLPTSYIYFISNPTDQQLQELQCKRVCEPCNPCSPWSGNSSITICYPCYSTNCIQIYAVDFLGTITLGREKLLKIKVSDRNGGKIEEFIKAVGVEYIEWND